MLLRLPCPSWKRETYFLAQVVNMASPGVPVAMKIMSVELGNTDREKIKEQTPKVKLLWKKYILNMLQVCFVCDTDLLMAAQLDNACTQ